MKAFLDTYPGYAVTDDGNVWSDKTNKFLKPYQGATSKYLMVMLRIDGKSVNRLVHRLVLEGFVGPCPPGMEGCHNDGDMLDNRLINLRWDTRVANRQDAAKHGTLLVGTDHTNCKLKPRDIRMMIYMWFTKLFTQKEIAGVYNITQQKVSQIVNRERHSAIWVK